MHGRLLIRQQADFGFVLDSRRKARAQGTLASSHACVQGRVCGPARPSDAVVGGSSEGDEDSNEIHAARQHGIDFVFCTAFGSLARRVCKTATTYGS
jgi:hypothetical protein